MILPKMGLTMDEGEIVTWRKREGDEVSAGEILFEVESDKATLEVESPASGFVRRILVEAGATVPVTTVVALISETSDEPLGEVGALGPTPIPSQLAGSQQSRSLERSPQLAGSLGADPSGAELATSGTDRAKASPAARKRAQELGVDIAVVAGTGPGGRVTLEDVEAAAPGRGRAPG